MQSLTLKLALCLALVVCVASAEEYYPDTYDDTDLDKILGNEELRLQYYYCSLGTGPCLTPDAQFYKDHFPEVITTQCKKCTEKQKQNWKKVSDWYIKNQPEQWDLLTKKYLKSEPGKDSMGDQ